MITAYLNVDAYAEFHRWLGRGPALQPMWDAWSAGDRKGALEAIPDEVVDELVVHGSAAECRAHVQRYVDNGVTIPAPMVIPVGIDLAEAVPVSPRRPDSSGGGQHGRRSTSAPPRSPTSPASVRAKEVGARELTRSGAWSGSKGSTRIYNAFVAVDGERALPTPPPLDDQIAGGGDPGPWPASPSASRTSRTRSATAPPTGRRSTQDDPPATSTIPSSPGCGRPAASSSARPTPPSSAGWATRPTPSSALP